MPEYFLCIVPAIFSAAVIFVSQERVFHLHIIQKNASSLTKFPFSFFTIHTVFFHLRYRFATLQAVMFFYKMEASAAHRTDSKFSARQYPVTYRTAWWIQRFQKQFPYCSEKVQSPDSYIFFIQNMPFSPMARSLYSASWILLSSELYLLCCFSLLIISRKVSSLPTTVTHFLALVTAV